MQTTIENTSQELSIGTCSGSIWHSTLLTVKDIIAWFRKDSLYLRNCILRSSHFLSLLYINCFSKLILFFLTLDKYSYLSTIEENKFYFKMK